GRQQGFGVADRLDRHVDADAVGQGQDVGGGVVAGFHGVGGAEIPRHVQPELVRVDRDDPGGTPQPGGQDGGQAHRAGADHRDGVAGTDLPGENAHLVAGRQRVGEEDGLLVGDVGRDRVQRGVGVGDADRFGLGAVDQVAEDPADAADRLAVRGHAALAVLALAALGDGGDEHAVTDAESLDGVADLGDRAYGLVAEDAAVGDGGHVTVQDVQVGAADRGGVDSDHDVGRFPDGCIGDVFPRLLARSVVYEGFH